MKALARGLRTPVRSIAFVLAGIVLVGLASTVATSNEPPPRGTKGTPEVWLCHHDIEDLAESGADWDFVKDHLDGVRTSNYSESLGDPGYLFAKRRYLNGVQRVLHGHIPLYSGTGIKSGATRDTIIDGIRMAYACGAAGITLGHYDCATMERLAAVGDAVRSLNLGG